MLVRHRVNMTEGKCIELKKSIEFRLFEKDKVDYFALRTHMEYRQ